MLEIISIIMSDSYSICCTVWKTYMTDMLRSASL